MTNRPDEDEEKQDSFEFDDSGEERAYISLDQARIQAMSSAREVPGEYGRLSQTPMAFEVVEAGETEDFYEITLSFRPQGEFAGTPGQEQFFIGKDGRLEHRQVVSLPHEERSRDFRWAGLLMVGVLMIVAAAVVGAVIVFGGFGGDDGVPAAPARSWLETRRSLLRQLPRQQCLSNQKALRLQRFSHRLPRQRRKPSSSERCPPRLLWLR